MCDRNRRIVYWSKSSERITGWRSEDVLGRACHENILCHEDKDGHRLCGKEYCPLHRTMITGVTSTTPIIVFARAKDGHRIPMQVTTAPLYDAVGEVIGGIETFRDVSPMLEDLERAKLIQSPGSRLSIVIPGSISPQMTPNHEPVSCCWKRSFPRSWTISRAPNRC